MIFVCLGSREYQFDRLLKELDKLIDEKIITDEVFAQIGQSTYIPRNYKYERFLSTDEFKEMQKAASLIISHAGTGALMNSLKLGKKVIAVPRLEKYGEHTDDHQLQIASVLSEQGYLQSVTDMSLLGETVIKANHTTQSIIYDRPSSIIEEITNFIENDTDKYE